MSLYELVKQIPPQNRDLANREIRKIILRIARRRQITRDQYEQEQELEREQKCQM